MQDRDVRTALRQRLLDELLATRPACPGPLVLRCIAERENHRAQTRMTLAHSGLAPGLSPLMQRIAARGARYGFPGWTETVELKNGKTKTEYLSPTEATAKAREYLDGAKTPPRSQAGASR